MKSLRKRLAAALLLTMTLAWFAAFALQHRMVTDERPANGTSPCAMRRCRP